MSNPAKPWNIAKKWAENVFEEFLNQGDIEKQNGFTISPYMDRNNTDQVKMAVSFIGNNHNNNIALSFLSFFEINLIPFLFYLLPIIILLLIRLHVPSNIHCILQILP